ncbi:MAG: hypothetical protein Q9159_004051 [Coniocarpon cinnabarinum]
MSSPPIDFERFTATGRPFGSAPIVAAGGAGGTGGTAIGPAGQLYGPDALPQRFTDESMILVPVRRSDIEDPDEDFEAWWSSLKAQSGGRRGSVKTLMRTLLLRSPAGAKKGDFIMLNMQRADYLRYCAKDEQGAYIGSEPQGESRLFLRDLLARQHGERSMSTASTSLNPKLVDTGSGSAKGRRQSHS